MVMLPARARAAKLPIDFSISAKLKLIGIAQNRHDQSAVGGDGDADVEIIVVHDVVVLDRGIHGGKLAQRLDARLGEERHEAELHAVLLLEGFFVARPQLVHHVQIDLVEGGEQRLGGLRLHHALGDARAQPRHGHALLGAAATQARLGRHRSGGLARGGLRRGMGGATGDGCAGASFAAR